MLCKTLVFLTHLLHSPRTKLSFSCLLHWSTCIEASYILLYTKQTNQPKTVRISNNQVVQLIIFVIFMISINSWYNNGYFHLFEFDYLKSAPVVLENFGYMDPRSLLLINKLITCSLAAKNMNKVKGDVNYVFKTPSSVIMAKSETKAALSRYYYTCCPF